MAASGTRQPFVTLWKGGRSARKTILLDYQVNGGIWAVLNWSMGRNRHWAIMFSTALTFTMSIAIVPLSSHIYQLKSTAFTSSIPLTYSTSFNQNGLNSTLNLFAAFGIASAITSYGSSPPSWMDALNAYPQFSTSTLPSNGSISVNTTAYSALLDCRILGPTDYTTSTPNNGTTLQITDRGCTITQIINAPYYASVYSMAWTEEACNSASGRLGLLVVTLENGSSVDLKDFTVISCIPEYWTSNGSLTVSLRPGNSPLVSSYQNNTQLVGISDFYTKEFEAQLSEYSVVDPQTEMEISSNELGRLVYLYAMQKTPGSPLDSQTLLNGMELIFPAIFAALATTQLFVPATSTTETATLSQAVNRIVVVPATCIIVIAIMFLILVSNIWLFVNARHDDSMLQEKPVGLLSSAVIAHDYCQDSSTAATDDITAEQSLDRFVQTFHGDNRSVTKIRKEVSDAYDIDKSVCYYDKDLGIIRVKGLNRLKSPHSKKT